MNELTGIAVDITVSVVLRLVLFLAAQGIIAIENDKVAVVIAIKHDDSKPQVEA